MSSGAIDDDDTTPALTEAELDAMTEEQLRAKDDQVEKDLIAAQADSIKASADEAAANKTFYEAEQSRIQASSELQTAESKVQLLTNTIIQAESISNAQQSKIVQLEAEIAQKDEAIYYTQQVLDGYTQELADLNTSLEASDARLSKEIAQNAIFKAIAVSADQAYSTFQGQGVEKARIYSTSFLAAESTTKGYSTLVLSRMSSEDQYSKLIEQSQVLNAEITAAVQTENDTLATSTLKSSSAKAAKSYYTSAILYKEYAVAYMAQQDAQAAFDSAAAALTNSPSDTTLIAAKTMAEQQLTSKTAIAAAAKSKVDTSADSALESQYADLDQQIAAEASLEESYRQLATTSRALAKEQETLRDAALTDVQTQLAVKATAEANLPRLLTTQTEKRKAADDAEILYTTLVSDVDVAKAAWDTAETTYTEKKRAQEAAGAELQKAQADQAQLIRDISGLLIEVTKSKAALDTADSEYTAVKRQAVDLDVSIKLNTQEIKRAETESKTATLQMAKYDAMLVTAKESYEQTFVRQIRAAIQSDYEDAIAEAVAAATPSGATGPVDISGSAVSQNPKVQMGYTALQAINSLLDNYDNYAAARKTVDSLLATLQDKQANAAAAMQAFDQAQTAMEMSQQDMTLKAALIDATRKRDDAMKALQAAEDVYKQSADQLAAMGAAIQNGRAKLFPNSADIQAQQKQVEDLILAGQSLA